MSYAESKNMLIVGSQRKLSYGASLDYLYSFSATQEMHFYIMTKDKHRRISLVALSL